MISPVVQIERSAVGGVLVHPKVFVEASPECIAGDFYEPAHGAIWGAFEALDRERRPIDPITVWEQMRVERTVDRLKHCGGHDYIARLMAEVVTVENIAYHARLVRKHAEKRRWATTLRELADRAHNDAEDLEIFFSGSEAQLLRLLEQGRHGAARTVDSYDGMKAAVARAELAFATREDPRPRGVPTGNHLFDRISRGLHPGQLLVIGGRPGMGKSAYLGLNIETAIRAGMPSLLFSLEMPGEEYFDRMLAAGGVEADRLRTGFLSPDDFMKITRTASELGNDRLLEIDDEVGLPINEVRSRARRWRAHGGRACRACRKLDDNARCGHAVVAVDYLQLIKSSRRDSTRTEEVAEVARGLKELARELKLPVIALAQVLRSVDKRDDQRPTMSDLKESGEIEQSADIIAFLYREEKANRECPADQRGTAEFIMAKGRNLPSLTIPLLFQDYYTRFLNPKVEP